MASAYYSRNNSYSRSYNASVAETEERFPLTRAAAHLGLSVASFKKGLEVSGIGTSEWHHVGKYASRVDYYDVSDESEIMNSLSFWNGARNKCNKSICDNYRKDCLKRKANERLSEKMAFIIPTRKIDSEREIKWFIRKCIKQTIESRIKKENSLVYWPTKNEVLLFVNTGKMKIPGSTVNLSYSDVNWNDYSFLRCNLPNNEVYFVKK